MRMKNTLVGMGIHMFKLIGSGMRLHFLLVASITTFAGCGVSTVSTTHSAEKIDSVEISAKDAAVELSLESGFLGVSNKTGQAFLSDDFESRSFNPVLWGARVGPISFIQPGIDASTSIQMVSGAFLPTIRMQGVTKDYAVLKFALKVAAIPSNGDIFTVRVSHGKPADLSNADSIVFKLAKNETGIRAYGPRPNNLIMRKILAGVTLNVALLFKENEKQYRIFVDDVNFGLFNYATSNNFWNAWNFSMGPSSYFSASFHAPSSAPVIIDNVKAQTIASSQTLDRIWNSKSVRLDVGASLNRGQLQPFYRGTQLQAQGLASGYNLSVVPAEWTKPSRSFLYPKRPYDKEVLFADTLSIVRFSGGWSPNIAWGENNGKIGVGDLAYIENDVLKFRLDKIKARLDPYVTRGYRDLIISLDNVPFDLAAPLDGTTAPVMGYYGQQRPPRSAEEWRLFVAKMAEELKRLYPDDAPRWKFRIGTETNCASTKPTIHTFRGSNLEFRDWYTNSDAALKSIFGSNVSVGPGEVGGAVNCGIAGSPESKELVDYKDLIGQCSTGSCNVSFLSSSSHAIPKRLDTGALVGEIDPDSRVESTSLNFGALLAANPSLGSIDKYIFQYGVLQSELTNDEKNNIFTNEPGGRGAAWTMHSMFEMQERIGLKGIWNWSASDSLSADKHLMFGTGWLYTILDNLVGGEMRTLPSVRDLADTRYKTIFVTKGIDTYLLVSAFNVNRDVTAITPVVVEIPNALLPSATELSGVSYVRLSEKTSVHYAIRNALAKKGWLRPDFVKNPNLLAPVGNMATKEGVTWVRDHYSDFAEIETRLLTLKPFRTKSKELYTQTGGGVNLQFNMEPGSIIVIKLESKAVPYVDVMGVGCADRNCIWLTGRNIEPDVEVVVSTADQSRRLGVYRKPAIFFSSANGVQQVSFTLATEEEKTLLHTGGIMVRVANPSRGNWSINNFIASPNVSNLGAIRPIIEVGGPGCSDNFCVWLTGTDFDIDSVVDVRQVGSGEVIATYGRSQRHYDVKNGKTSVSFQLRSDREKELFATEGLRFWISNPRRGNWSEPKYLRRP